MFLLELYEGKIKLDKYLKRLLTTWIIILTASTGFMLFLLLTGQSSLNFTLVIFLTTIKFLAGFGLIIGIISIGQFVLEKFSDQFKGKENQERLTILMVGLVVIPIILFIYNIVKIVQSYLIQASSQTLVDNLLFIYGIGSLLVSLYIVPVIKGEFAVVTTVSTGDMIKKSAKKTYRGFKKRLFQLTNNFGKANLQDQKLLKEYLSVWRQRIAVIALIALGLGSFVFTPICAILVISWVRIYFLTKRPFSKYEAILLVCAIGAITLISILMPFVLELTEFYSLIQSNYYLIDISYTSGVLIGTAIYLKRFLQPRMQKWKLNKRDRKISKLEAEKSELKEQLDT